MTLRWTRGHTFFLPEHFFGKLKVRGDPDVDVQAARGLPRELEEVGAHLEIRVRPASADLKELVRLYVWEDRDSRQAVTETLPSETDARLRAEQVVQELAQRLSQRQGRGGYRGEAPSAGPPAGGRRGLVRAAHPGLTSGQILVAARQQHLGEGLHYDGEITTHFERRKGLGHGRWIVEVPTDPAIYYVALRDADGAVRFDPLNERGEAIRAARRGKRPPAPGQSTVEDLQVGDRFTIGPEDFQSVYTVEWLGEPRVAVTSQHRRGTGQTPTVKGFRRKVRVRVVGRRASWGELLTGEMELIQPVWIVPSAGPPAGGRRGPGSADD